jgi:hypothetical protein
MKTVREKARKEHFSESCVIKNMGCAPLNASNGVILSEIIFPVSNWRDTEGLHSFLFQ